MLVCFDNCYLLWSVTNYNFCKRKIRRIKRGRTRIYAEKFIEVEKNP